MILEFTKNSTVGQIIEGIKKIPDENIELIIPEDALLRQNPLNVKIIEKVANDLGKKLDFIKNLEAQKPEEELFQEGIDITEEKPRLRLNLREKLTGFSQRLKLFSPAFKNLPSKKFLIPGIFGSVIIGLLIFAYLFFPTAKIILLVEPKSIEREMQINATSKVDQVDLENAVIPLKIVEVDKEGQLSAKATGKKTIGEPAKGTIEIRNYNKNAKQFFESSVKVKVESGEKKGLEFTLDRATTVPTATTSRNNLLGREVTDPGRAEVNVTAVKIGAEGNIPSGTLLSVGNLDSAVVEAISANDFSQGKSQDITVVSSEDQKNLLETLSNQLYEKGQEEVKNKISADLKLPEGGIRNSVVKKTFDKDIDAEAKDFNLNLKTKSRATLYSEKDLKEALFKAAESLLPEGYELSQEQSVVDAQVIKSMEDEVLFSAKLKGNLIPKIDYLALRNSLRGKSFSQAKEILKELKFINGVEIKSSPSFLTFLSRLPFRSVNIKVELTSK